MKKVFAFVLAGILLSALIGCGAGTGPKDIKLSDAEKTVADARKMMAEKKENPKLYDGWIYAANLPESLRIPKLCYAQIFEDHVNLVLARNPDWQMGARIWAENSKTVHKDKPTSYPNVFFFQYTNDLPDSPDNLK